MVPFNKNHVRVVTFSPIGWLEPNLAVAAFFTWGPAALDGRPNGQVIINNDKWWWMIVSSIVVFFSYCILTGWKGIRLWVCNQLLLRQSKFQVNGEYSYTVGYMALWTMPFLGKWMRSIIDIWQRCHLSTSLVSAAHRKQNDGPFCVFCLVCSKQVCPTTTTCLISLRCFD